MLRNINRLTFAAEACKLNLTKSQSLNTSSQYPSNLTTQPIKNVLNSPELKKLRSDLNASIVGKPLYNEISKKILGLNDTRRPFVDKRLEAKLNYKLALLVLCFRRLTSACENDFIDDTAKLELIKEIVLNELKGKNTEEIQNEFDFLDILGFNMDMTGTEDEVCILFKLI